MNSKLFIAEKIKVGFNPRNDTYSGRLAYIIGFDGKKWRKEPSWEGWRYHYMDDGTYQQKRLEQYNDKIAREKKFHAESVRNYKKNNNHYQREYAVMSEEDYLKKYVGPYEKFTPNLGRISSDENLKPIELENVPTEGFVLNKKVGGYSNGWDHRSTYCRVYDPRGFEFEITVPNLLFILQECNAMKGKGLEGSFVYAWDGKDLVLLPTSSLDYQESQKFTEIQSKKISVKDLVEGCTYKSKQMDEYIYMGRFNWFEEQYRYSSDKYNKVSCEKRHVFYKVTKNGGEFESFTGLTKFASKLNDIPVSNYADLLDKFNKSSNSGVIDTINEIDGHIPTELTYSFNTHEYFGEYYLPLGENQYEIYKVESDKVEYPNYSYYSNRKNGIESYKLTSRKVVSFKDGGFKLKTINPKIFENVSYEKLTEMKLKLVTINKNNKNRVLVF